MLTIILKNIESGFLKINSLIGLQNNQGFWDNFVWPLAVAIVIGLFVVFRKFLIKPKKERTKKLVLIFLIDQKNEIIINEDKELLSKLSLIKQIIRNSKTDEFIVTIKPTYKTSILDKFQKSELELKLKIIAQEIKDKIEILLLRPFDTSLETSAITIKKTIEGILLKRPFNVTGRIKLDIYRTQDPKISFPVYLTQEEFQCICKCQNMTDKELIQQMSIPTMTSMTIFPNELLYNHVLPELVNEIYRIKTRHNFDIGKEHWENVMGYEVGLG